MVSLRSHFFGNADPQKSQRVFQRLQRRTRERKTEIFVLFFRAQDLAVEIKFVVDLRQIHRVARDQARLVFFQRVGKKFGKFRYLFDEFEFLRTDIFRLVRAYFPAL